MPTARCAASPQSAAGRCSTSASSPTRECAGCTRRCSGSRSCSAPAPPCGLTRCTDADRGARLPRMPTRARSAEHFADAERRGKLGHGRTRVDWLETLPDLHPEARPQRLIAEPGYERWDGGGALGYLTLAAICDAQLAEPPEHARVIVAVRTVPDRRARLWARLLADGGSRRGVDCDLAAAAPAPRGRPAADGHESARDRRPELGRARARRRRLDGPRHATATCCAAPRARGARPVRRRARPQGVRARARPPLLVARARRRRLRRRARGRPAGRRPGAGATARAAGPDSPATPDECSGA